MNWWDDLWLNEGFASWAENWATDIIFPDWSMWNQFSTSRMAYGMKLDSLKSSHPIQVPIHRAEEVEEVFDAISYCKGASVVRMAKAVIGMKAFQTGLQRYMANFKYGNTETLDLWTAWEESSGIPVKELMASWTEQMGFPLLRVLDESWDDDKVTLQIEQSWFLLDGSALSDEEEQKKWTIPLITCTEEGTQQEIIFMREKTASITIPLKNKSDWVKLNAGQEVIMRVLPTDTMIIRLSDAIKAKTLPVCDRGGLVTDAYALVKAGHMKPETLIKLLSSFIDEDSYIVWQGLADALTGLYTVLQEDEDISKNLILFARKLVLKLVSYTGWDKKEDDGHLTVLLRSTVINLVCLFCYDEADIIAEAKRRFDSFLSNPDDVSNLPSDLKSAVFGIVLKNGGQKEFDSVKGYFYSAKDQAEKKFVLGTLGMIQEPKLKERTLEWAISGDVKLQDFFYPMGSVGYSSKVGKEVAWKFFQTNFETIRGMIGKGSPSLMDACIVNCAGGFCSLERADEIDQFFQTHPLPQNARKIAQTTGVFSYLFLHDDFSTFVNNLNFNQFNRGNAC